MKPKKRQKMCYNCEGEIDLDVIVCPYCAADLREEKPEQSRPSYRPTVSLKNLSTQESLYPSHYTPKPSSEEGEEPGEEALSAPLAPEEETKTFIGPTILLTLGAQLLLFGLLMLFFSRNGVMVLQWDARLWYLYLFASIPLLIYGYRSVSKI